MAFGSFYHMSKQEDMAERKRWDMAQERIRKLEDELRKYKVKPME